MERLLCRAEKRCWRFWRLFDEVLRCDRCRVPLHPRKRRHLIEPNPKFLQPGFKVQAVSVAQIGNPRQDRPGCVVGFLGLGEERRSPGSRHIQQRKSSVKFPADENLPTFFNSQETAFAEITPAEPDLHRSHPGQEAGGPDRAEESLGHGCPKMTAHSGGTPDSWNAYVAPKAKRIQRRERTLPENPWRSLPSASIRAARWVPSFSCSRGRVSESHRTPE